MAQPRISIKLFKKKVEHLVLALPHQTYCVDRQVADSGSTATAYLCGVKTNYYTVGVDAGVTGFDCTTVFEENKVSSIGQWALEAGKRAGQSLAGVIL